MAMKERKKPETLRLRTVTPSFTVQDIDASVAYYRDVLGFVVEDSYDDDSGKLRAVQLKAGTLRFFLNQDDFAKGSDRTKGVGFRLWCVTTQDLDQLAADVEARGGELAHPVTERSWGGRDFAVVDPDGYVLSFTNPESL
jgi:uncharacterized glyoxalase superfamily protein PhnB